MESILSLGSNLGDRLAHLVAARRAISSLPHTRLVACSRVYETTPVDAPDTGHNPEFLNAVMVIETVLPVQALADALFAIEDRLGRVRAATRNAPRTLDIDIISCGNLIHHSPLTLPHPRATARRFVCEPLAELRPDLVLPGQAQTVRAILTRLPLVPRVAVATRQWPT